MNGKTTKIALSVQKETLSQLEQMRAQLGLTRSAAADEAFRLWVREKLERELEDRYVKGYEKKPERSSETEALFRAGLSSFTTEEW